MTTNTVDAIRVNVVSALTAADASWVEYGMCELAYATTHGSVRVPIQSFKFFINCSHRLGFRKRNGVLVRGESLALSEGQNKVIAKIILDNVELLNVVVEGVRRGEGRSFPAPTEVAAATPEAAPKATRKEKQAKAVEEFSKTPEAKALALLKAAVAGGGRGGVLKRELRALLSGKV